MFVIRVFTILIGLVLVDAFLDSIVDEAIVSLQENIYGNEWAHLCTGVLVGKKKLMLIAAHCIENKMHLFEDLRGPIGDIQFEWDRLKVSFTRNN